MTTSSEPPWLQDSNRAGTVAIKGRRPVRRARRAPTPHPRASLTEQGPGEDLLSAVLREQDAGQVMGRLVRRVRLGILRQREVYERARHTDDLDLVRQSTELRSLVHRA